jgi:hypothetical protein
MIDWTKPIKTFDGREAKLIHTFSPDSAWSYPKLLVVKSPGVGEALTSVTDDGFQFIGGKEPFVRNVPEERFSDTIYVNEYKDCGPCVHWTPMNAKHSIDHKSYIHTTEWKYSSTKGWVKVRTRKL